MGSPVLLVPSRPTLCAQGGGVSDEAARLARAHEEAAQRGVSVQATLAWQRAGAAAKVELVARREVGEAVRSGAMGRPVTQEG